MKLGTDVRVPSVSTPTHHFQPYPFMTPWDRISFNAQILGGRACIRGMRISVALVLNLMAAGMTSAEILEAYPDLEPEDLRQVLCYAA